MNAPSRNEKENAATNWVTHILFSGVTTLCGRTLNDENWPSGHDWVTPSNGESIEKSTCAKCRGEAGLEVHSEHFLDQIDSIYAFLSVDEGGEGIIGLPIGPDGSMVPLIASDKTRMGDIIPLAKRMAQAGMKIKLVRFVTREIIEEFNPT